MSAAHRRRPRKGRVVLRAGCLSLAHGEAYNRTMLIDGYVRISQVAGRSGDSFISPALQREQILRWASAHGHRLAVVHEELDQSGGRADRPKLLEALARVEDGTIDGLAVAKLDRFGRSLIDGLAAIQRIHDAGGTFISVADGLDLSTDTGKLVLRIMLAMAEWELDRIRSTWDAAVARATGRGMHIAATPPTGYTRDEARRLHPDPNDGPVISEMFRRRTDGATIAELRLLLESCGVQSSHGSRHWTHSSVTVLLANRAYLGEVHQGPYVCRDAHPALIDEATWYAAQQPRANGPVARTATPTLAGGLLRCAACGLVLNSGNLGGSPSHPYRSYHCPTVSSAGDCPRPARIRGWEAEHLLELAFFTAVRQRPIASRRNTALQRTLRMAQDDLDGMGRRCRRP